MTPEHRRGWAQILQQAKIQETYSWPSISTVPPNLQIRRTTNVWYCSIHYRRQSTCKWTHAVQTRVVQGPTVYLSHLVAPKSQVKCTYVIFFVEALSENQILWVNSTSHKHLLSSRKEQTYVNSKVAAPREVGSVRKDPCTF